MAGLTSNGLEILRLPDVISEQNTNAVILFQDLVPSGDVVNTATNSLLGRIIALNAPMIADLWEATEEVNSSFDITKATGTSLDNLMLLGGVKRKGATATSGNVLLTGNVGTLVSAGKSIKSASTGKTFTLTDSTTFSPLGASGIALSVSTLTNNTTYSFSFAKVIDSSNEGTLTVSVTTPSTGTITRTTLFAQIITAITTTHSSRFNTPVQKGELLYIDSKDAFIKYNFTNNVNVLFSKASNLSFAVCDETGVITQDANTVQTIATPILGWDSVNNPSAMTAGTLKETDEEARLNFIKRKSVDGNSSYEAVYSGIDAVTGVVSSQLYENDTDVATTNPYLEPHSFMAVVLGGSSQDIAKAILTNAPAGIGTNGDVSVTVTDTKNVPHIIKFRRPTTIDISVSLNITIQDGFDSGGIQTIKDNLVAYIAGLAVGEDVIYSRLFTPINAVSGHYVNSLQIKSGTNPFSSSNININFFELASLSASNITITQS